MTDIGKHARGVWEEDDLYPDAVRIVREKSIPSISCIQRHLKIGYNRAARLLEEMERQGVVSPLSVDGCRHILDEPPAQNCSSTEGR